jgi:NADPH:quinone reductase
MRAWRVHELGEPDEVMRLDEAPSPALRPGAVLIDVEACALNFSDVLLCRGGYQIKPDLPFTPGLEVAGTIAAVADDVADVSVGQRVIASPVPGEGGLAEQIVVDVGRVLPIPASMDAVAAAALHITYSTGHVALYRRARLQAGETLLVHAGAGGVGSAAIQLGRARGARVIATAGGAAKAQICRDQGADLAIDYRAGDWVAAVMAATAGNGVDVVYDPVGGDIFDLSRRCLGFEGRILVIGFAGGRIAAVKTNSLLLRNCDVIGVDWNLYARRAPEIVRAVHDDLIRLHQANAIAPLVSERVPLVEAGAAVSRLGARESWGKIVVLPRG